MVVASPEATVSGAGRHEHASRGESPAASAGITGYHLAAARTLTLSNLLLTINVGLLVLIATGWVLGLLPGAVRLF